MKGLEKQKLTACNILTARACRLSQAYGKAADVFSFGVVLWELVTLNIPWHEDDKKPPPETAADGAAGNGACAGGTRDPPPEEPTYQDPTMFVVLNVPTGIRLELPKTIDPPLPELPMVSWPSAALLPSSRHPIAWDLCSIRGCTNCRRQPSYEGSQALCIYQSSGDLYTPGR